MKLTVVKTRTPDTLLDELERMRQLIADRAFDIFRGRGAALGSPLDDWLAAEHQTMWTPAIELCEREGEFVLEAAVAGVEPRELDIQVTPETLLIKADTHHGHTKDKGVVHMCEFRPGQLFRSISFPKRIDPAGVTAEYRNGLLRVVAPVAAEKRGRKIKVEPA